MKDYITYITETILDYHGHHYFDLPSGPSCTTTSTSLRIPTSRSPTIFISLSSLLTLSASASASMLNRCFGKSKSLGSVCLSLRLPKIRQFPSSSISVWCWFPVDFSVKPFLLLCAREETREERTLEICVKAARIEGRQAQRMHTFSSVAVHISPGTQSSASVSRPALTLFLRCKCLHKNVSGLRFLSAVSSMTMRRTMVHATALFKIGLLAVKITVPLGSWTYRNPSINMPLTAIFRGRGIWSFQTDWIGKQNMAKSTKVLTTPHPIMECLRFMQVPGWFGSL